MLTNWLVLTIIAGLGSAVFSSFLRHTLKKGVDPTAYAWWFELIRAAFFLLVIPFDNFLIVSPVSLTLLLALGLSEFVAVYLFMKMHASNELSLSTIIMQLRAVWVSILAFVFLGEVLALSEWLGILGVFLGAVIVSRPKVLSPDKGLVYAFFVTIISALSAIILKKTITIASLPINIFIFSLPSVFLLPLFMKNAHARIVGAMRPALTKGLIGSLANIISMSATTLALHYGSPGVVTGVFQGITMLTVVFGIVFLGERQDIARKLLGAAITISGILLLT